MAGQPQAGQTRTSGGRVQSQAARTVGNKTSGGNTPKSTPPRKRSRVPLVATSLVVAGALAVGIGVFASKFKKISGGKSIGEIRELVQNPRGYFPGQDRVNILLIGKDYSYVWTKSNVKLNGAPYSKENSRSDSIMMLSLDMKAKKISALSIPRDTWVDAPDGKTGKINATFARGGHELLEGTVADLLGVKPDYYVAITPEVVKKVVDKLGGVEVETIDKMVYNDSTAHLHINLPEGKQLVDGDQAVGYARFRELDPVVRDDKGNPFWTGRKDAAGNPIFRMKTKAEIARSHSKEEGDPRRMARQRLLIAAMKSKAVTPSNLMQLDDIINVGLGAMETDLSRTQILALASLFRSTPTDQIESASLVTWGRKRQSIYGPTFTMEVDQSKKDALVDWLLKGDESAANRFTVVSVENGTLVPGAAKRVATLLKAQGFTARTGNAEHEAGEVPSTRIVYGKAMFAPRAQKIAQLLGGGQLVKEVKPETVHMRNEELNEADVTIVLGRDLAGQFGQRSASL